MTAWSEDDWADAWKLLTGQWPTLRREGAEAGYRHVLTRFGVEAVADAVMAFITDSSDEPKAADIAAHIRRASAPRPAVADDGRDGVAHDPASVKHAWEIAQTRHARGAGLGLAQWIALGCPSTNVDRGDMLGRVAVLVTEDDRGRVAVDADASRGWSRPVRGIGSVGPAIRSALRVAHEHDRALALRRLATVMQPDDLALLTDEVTP